MSRPRLSNRTLAQAGDAWTGGYDRAAVEVGIVHLGPGAFHRAHQAPVFDTLLAGDPRWGVCDVALRSDRTRQALGPQDGLYTLVELDAAPRMRIVGAVAEVLTASKAPGLVLSRMAALRTRMITLTVTEKGYCLTPAGDLDFGHPDVVADVARPAAPRSAVGWLVEALRLRRRGGAGGLAVVSCDNLTDNGGKLGRAVADLARAQGDADVAAWITAEVRFPATMVDAITPATDDTLRRQVREAIGLTDAWPVQRERFSQWVVEDQLGPGGPDLARAGVQIVADVRPFEQAKLRLLNGAHSSLAYLGLLAGRRTVADAMADPLLARFVERLMREDIAPSLPRTAGLDLDAYIAGILARFRNSAISHQLAQIAQDGSQKLPFRLVGTIADALAAGRPVERLAIPIAGWMVFAARRAQDAEPLVDPLAGAIAGIAAAPAEVQVERFLGLGAVFPPAQALDPNFRTAVASAHRAITQGQLSALLAH